MAKITLQDPSSGYSSLTTFQENNTAIEEALNDKVLYRDNPAGETNTMQSDLDMNSNRILNLPGATTANEPVTKSQLDAVSGTLSPVGFQAESITGTDSQTLFTFSTVNYTLGSNTLLVFINGVYQPPSAYSETSTTSITLSAGVVANDVLSVIVLSLT